MKTPKTPKTPRARKTRSDSDEFAVKEKPQKNTHMYESENTFKKLILGAVATIIAITASVILVEFKTVRGGELGVKETWTDGVVQEVYQPRNYWLIPGFSQEIYTYDATLKAFELKDYTIRSSDNQEMTIMSKIQWRRDPSKLIRHHTMFKQNAEKIAIEPAMIGAILRNGTAFKAIEAYSGEGLIKMQSEIQKDLLANTQLKEDGIIIESYIIVYNHLKPEYLAEINGRQLATLRQSRASEEQKAAEAEALVAKSKAQSDLNKQVVEAERDKQVLVLKAEAENERSILAAKAEKEKLSLEAEGKKLAMLAEAEGTLALGEAKAKANRAMLESFSVQGSESYTRIEIAKNLATAFGNIKGYLPGDLKINVLTDNFNTALDAATGNMVLPAKSTGVTGITNAIGPVLPTRK